MSFSAGDIPFYQEYTFTDTSERRPHFGLILLPEKATQYQESNLCCVITHQCPISWGYKLKMTNYAFFSKDSFVCLNRKDLVPKMGLGSGTQPRGTLNNTDFKQIFKALKKSFYCIKDIASDPFLKGTIIREWKQKIISFSSQSVI